MTYQQAPYITSPTWSRLRNKRYSGFTIVELVIVIVTIAILATIGVVTYNSIQYRARNAQFLAAYDSYEKAIMNYYTLNGTYPMSATPTHQTPSDDTTDACIGSGYTANTDFPSNVCVVNNGASAGSTDSAVDAAFSTVMQSTPSVGSQVTLDLSTIKSRGLFYRAIHHTDSSQWTAAIYYYIQGDQSCGRGKKTPLGEFTICQILYADGNKSSS